MTMESAAVHAPALTRQEAAMLPALTPPSPGNLLMPRNYLDFRRGALDEAPAPRQERRGSMAGRALLSHVGWGRGPIR